MKPNNNTSKPGNANSKNAEAPANPVNFIRQIVDKATTTVVTRFPPEPNGYLHIGHAKSICLNFGLARDYQGRCHLRFDDTNPEVEEVEYTNAIQEDVKWLGFDWGKNLFYASDYFEQIYQWAEKLIMESKAYVDSQTEEQVKRNRGDFTTPGTNSPFRERTVEENLNIFRRMRQGEFADGSHILRAKIDMNSPNMNMRDPILYRIKKVHHHRTENKWVIYPMYDFAHPLSDAIEHITHSICTLEFEDHRPFYDWTIQQVGTDATPQQIEFARLNLTYTLMSKRKLLRLVKEKLVWGWNDPRMPTISGLRRRGYTPSALRNFAEKIGVTKKDSVIEVEVLENCLRDDLDQSSYRALAVLKPLKVIVENWPAEQVLEIQAQNHPKNPEMGKRTLFFTKEIYIDREDFSENPPADFIRFKPGGEVRLRNAYIIKCVGIDKGPDGQVVSLRATCDLETLGKNPSDGRKVKGIVHWVSVSHSFQAEVRLFDRLMSVPDPENVPEGKDFTMHLNPHSLEVVRGAQLELSLKNAKSDQRFQFERVGYFCADCVDHTSDSPVFNLIVSLKDSYKKD